MANVNTNFVPKRGVWRFDEVKIKPSVAMAEGAAIGIEIATNTTTGYKTLMGVENAAGADFVGILMQPVASGDADYASTTKRKLVAIPMDQSAIAEFTASNGTFTVADEGKTVQFASTSLGLDVDTAGKGARIERYISATRGECSFVLPNTETA